MHHYNQINFILTLKYFLVISLLVLHVPRESLFTSTHFFVLNLLGWFDAFSNMCIVFWCSIIILSFNLKSTIISCLFPGDVYLSLSISLSFSELFCCEFFDISLFYYFNLSSSKISCLSSGDAYLSLGISLSCSFLTVWFIFCEFFETFVILLAILFSFKLSLASAVFRMTLLKKF